MLDLSLMLLAVSQSKAVILMDQSFSCTLELQSRGNGIKAFPEHILDDVYKTEDSPDSPKAA